MFQYPIDVTKPVERLYTTTGQSVLPQGKIFENNSEYKATVAEQPQTIGNENGNSWKLGQLLAIIAK